MYCRYAFELLLLGLKDLEEEMELSALHVSSDQHYLLTNDKPRINFVNI